MDYRIRLHALAESELDTIYDTILAEAGPVVAGQYVGGLYDFIRSMTVFAERGTVRCPDCASSAIAVAPPLPLSLKAIR